MKDAIQDSTNAIVALIREDRDAYEALISKLETEVEALKCDRDRLTGLLSGAREQAAAVKAELELQSPHRIRLESDLLAATERLREIEVELATATARVEEFHKDSDEHKKIARDYAAELTQAQEAIGVLRLLLHELREIPYDIKHLMNDKAWERITRQIVMAEYVLSLKPDSAPVDPYSGRLGDINLRMLAGKMHAALGLLKRQGCYHPAMDMMREEGFKHGLNLPGEGSDA